MDYGMDEVEYCQYLLDQFVEKWAVCSKVLTVTEILGWIALGLSVAAMAWLLWRDRTVLHAD